MPNTVFGPYSPQAWVDGATALNQTHLNNLETQASIALHGVNGDFTGSFVLSGITCARDGVTLNQLDVTSGTAYITMTDGTVGKIAVTASTPGQFVTSTPSTTYYLFLKQDGTWQWSTSSVGGNAIPICQATTDGSSNINVVTDVRHNAGSPGIALVVARALNVNVTVTADQTLITYNVPVRGVYRSNLYFMYQNATPQKVIASARWTDPDSIVTGLANFILGSPTSNVGQALTGSQASSTGNNQACACLPVTFYAQGGGVATIHFQDGGGTPNDFVTAVIERIG